MYTFLKGSCAQPNPAFREKKYLFWDDIAQTDVNWNFEKFLIDQDGIPRWRFADSAWGDHGEFVEPFLQQLLTERNSSPRVLLSITLAMITVATVLFSRAC